MLGFQLNNSLFSVFRGLVNENESDVVASGINEVLLTSSRAIQTKTKMCTKMHSLPESLGFPFR